VRRLLLQGREERLRDGVVEGRAALGHREVDARPRGSAHRRPTRRTGRIQSVVATLDQEELRWARSDGQRIGLGGRRCARRGVRRSEGWSIVSGFGRRSRADCRARMLWCKPGYRRRSASGGFGRVAGCRPSRWLVANLQHRFDARTELPMPAAA
jgi:hypothetical protein